MREDGHGTEPAPRSAGPEERGTSYGMRVLHDGWAPDPVTLSLLGLVEQTHSISGAAAQGGLSQGAASRRLATLERQLGLRLLIRTPNGTRLTDHGRLVAEWSASITSAYEGLLTGVDALRDAREVKIRVAASLTVAEYLAPGWFARLRRAQPRLEVGLVLGNSAAVIEQVRGSQVDLGFVESTTPSSGLESTVVAEDRLIVVIAPQHPWAQLDRPLSVSDLLGCELIVREQGSGTRAVFESALGARGIPPVALELPSNAAVKVAVESGLAPAVVSILAVEAEIRQGRLVGAPLVEVDLRRQIRAVWMGRPSPAAQELIGIATTTARACL